MFLRILGVHEQYILFYVQQPPQEDRSSSVTIGIPDEHIGIVVGRGGRNIMEMSQVCT